MEMITTSNYISVYYKETSSNIINVRISNRLDYTYRTDNLFSI